MSSSERGVADTDAVSVALTQMAVANHWTNVNRGPSVEHAVWSLLALSTLVVGLRLYVKLRKTKRLYWDDAFIILALALAYGHAICISRTVHYGLGRHMAFITAANRESALQTGFISLLFGHFAPMLGRISFSILLLHLTATDRLVKAWPTILLIALQLVVNVVAVIILFSQCGRNLDILWTPSKQMRFEAECWDPKIQTRYGYFQGSFNTATDFYLTVIPALLIAHSKFTHKMKFELGLFLCLSSLAMIASAVKTYEAKLLSQFVDFTYDLCTFVIWMSVETSTVIIASSMPVLRTLFVRKTAGAPPPSARYHVAMSSIFSRKSGRESKHMSSTSEEHLAQSVDDQEAGRHTDGNGINVTREVIVTYDTRDVPFVHAALVGLVQGEIMNRQPRHRGS